MKDALAATPWGPQNNTHPMTSEATTQTMVAIANVVNASAGWSGSNLREPALVTRSIKKRRSKSGCLTCRLRHKKCEEQKPTCDGCMRNHLICTWPQTNQSRKSKSISKERLTHASNGIKPPTWKRPMTPILYTASPSPIPPDAGMTTELSVVAVPGLLRRPISQWPILYRIPHSLKLLQHYVESTSTKLSAFARCPNPFLHIFLPLACDSDDILHALLALSSSHLSAADERFIPIACSHYAVALRAAKYLVTEVAQGDYSRSQHLLTLLLLLSHFEVTSQIGYP